jgi:hypothetical protein
MAALELLLSTTSTFLVQNQVDDNSIVVGTTLLDSPKPIIFGFQYHVFKMSKCLAKLSSQLGYNQY